jgi:hypothetical protein
MLMTGRWSMRRPIVSREVFSCSNSDRTHPLGRDRTHPSVRSTQTLATRWCNASGRLRPLPCNRAPDAPVYLGQRPLAQLTRTSAWTDRTRRCPRGQRPVTSSDLFRLRFFAESPLFSSS